MVQQKLTAFVKRTTADPNTQQSSEPQLANAENTKPPNYKRPNRSIDDEKRQFKEEWGVQ